MIALEVIASVLLSLVLLRVVFVTMLLRTAIDGDDRATFVTVCGQVAGQPWTFTCRDGQL